MSPVIPGNWSRLTGPKIDVRVCDLSFRSVVEAAVSENWTRDPFDRLIVANAKARRAPLLSKDERIRLHYARAIW